MKSTSEEIIFSLVTLRSVMTMTYGTDTWSLLKPLKLATQRAMKRVMLVVSLRVKIHNEEIYEKIKVTASCSYCKAEEARATSL